MSEPGEPGKAAFSGRRRLCLVVVALGLWAPLAVVTTLEPDRRGYGTHQQLGLPSCTVMFLFDRRCLCCGMTTAWAHLVRGQVVRALAANVGGTLLGVLALTGGPWLLACAVGGRWLGWVPNPSMMARGARGIVIVMLVDWGFRLLAG